MVARERLAPQHGSSHRVCQVAPTITQSNGFLGPCPCIKSSKRHLRVDQFSRFYKAYCCARQTDSQTTLRYNVHMHAMRVDSELNV